MTKIRLLQVEDDETDALLVLRQLKKEGFEVEHTRVKTRPEMEAELEKGGWDLVISDYSMPGFSGLEALRLFKSRNLDIPFILVSGTVGEDLAVSIMKEGADDYLMKSSLNRLGPAIKRELEEMQVRIEKKQAQKELIQAKLAAEESSRVKSSLLANMSHEFRTPMNGILGFTEILAAMITEQDQKDMTTHILASAKRLLKTLNSIMTFAQLDSGYTPNPVNIHLSGLITTSIEQIRQSAESKGLEIVSRVDPFVYVHADEYLLHTFLNNILDNAVKFTSKGSIEVVLSGKNDHEVTLMVTDSGIGIPIEKREVIFEEFRQANEGYNRPFEGSGLGLAITRKCVNLMNASLEVESEVGAGSSFRLILQRGFNQATDQTQPHKPSSTKRSPEPIVAATKILLVEDNDANIDLVKLYLNKYCSLDVAKDGLTSLKLTENNKYDCILMDINLGPGMDGGEAIEHIRKKPSYSHTPIIAVTGYTLQQEKEAILSKGADHYLPKPFNKAQLIELLDQVLVRNVSG
jgi:signal transduction histidine kinase